MNGQMIGQWILLGIILTITAFDKVRVWQQAKNDKNSKQSNPGNYGERIARLEARVKNIEEDIREIKRRMEKK